MESRFLPSNEPILTYSPGSEERAALNTQLEYVQAAVWEIPAVVGGKRIRSGETVDVSAPHDHRRVLARTHRASKHHVNIAIAAATKAQKEWSRWSYAERAAVFLKAAELLAGPWRQKLNAATMLGQSKTAHQAEIDSSCELIDFLRFNVAFGDQLQSIQPSSSAGGRNILDYRPLEGFVYAVTPFNFTAIAANLACAPALMGNAVVWKPAAASALSSYFVLELLEAAGLPAGVINFLPGDACTVSNAALTSPDFTGLHFTGSTAVFDTLWRGVAEHLEQYRNYPRLVGEAGGKDFILAHKSADVESLSVALLRGAFEYQGQKCSAASRAYIPASLWPILKERLLDDMATLKMGDVSDFSCFMGAVIDRRAFDRIKGHIARARNSTTATVLAGGICDDSTGYFVEPTIIQVMDPLAAIMTDEIFGPVLAVYIYPDDAWKDVLELVDKTSAYALTGAVFAEDRAALSEASGRLRFAAGNLYINDKPTGAVVGQQPFGGARRSGTNDKAGSMLNLLRWTSPRTIKETAVPARHYAYPHMA